MLSRPSWGVICCLVLVPALALDLASCSSDPPPAGLGQSCESRPCDEGLLCSDGVCAAPCNVDRDCLLRTDRCLNGVCVDAVTCDDSSDCRFPGACEVADNASCTDGICVYGPDPACGGQCATQGDCDGQAYCTPTGTCAPKLVDGSSCAGLTTEACASGFCDGDTDLCCSGADCCTQASDCPAADYAAAPSCNDTSLATQCQGTRGDPVCNNFICGTATVDDDSGCDGSIRACPSNFAPLICTNAVDQPLPLCGTSCAAVADCAPGFVCEAPNCVVPVGVGASCTGSGQGTCMAGLECENATCCSAGPSTCCGDAGDCSGGLNCDDITSTCFESCGNFDDSRCADPSTQYCLSNQCVSKSGQGTSCGNDGECLSGSCVEGVCCENDCAGMCQSCLMERTGQSDGLCRDSLVGESCDDGNVCSAVDVCDGAGSCVGFEDCDIEPLARYWINEATSGQGITELVDSMPAPLNLTITYANGTTPVFAEGADGNRHLFFSPGGGSDTGAARADIGGTKLDTLHGATEATLVAKYSAGDCSREMRIIGLGDGNSGSNGWLTLRTSSSEHNVYVKWQGESTASVYTFLGGLPCGLHSPTVVHVVVDTTLEASDRVRVFVNGLTANTQLFSGPPAPPGGLIDLGPGTRRLYVGGPHNGVRAALSRIYYAAVYNRALPEDQLWQEQARVLANDDAPSGRGVVTVPVCSDGNCSLATPAEWEAAREGDLTSRLILQVVPVSGTFTPGEPVTGPSCSGTFVGGLIPEFMTLDASSGSCVEGDLFTGGASGAEALLLDGLISGGTVEQAWVVAETYPELVIDGSVTDASHFMWLSAEPGSLHRGVPGVGVVIDPTADGHGIDIRDDYARVEWVEVTDWSGAGDSFDGINVTGDEVVINAALIHDDGHTITNSDANGITVEADNIAVAVLNSMVYNIARSGITIHQVGATLFVSNSSVYNCTLDDNNPSFYGCVGMRDAVGSTLHLNNVIAMGAVGGSDFFNGGSMQGVFGPSSNNMSSDTSAVGTDIVTGASPAATFLSITAGSEDLHCLPAGPADGAGIQGFYHDIDGDWRVEPSYNIGADAFP